jgi:hypothetical protein
LISAVVGACAADDPANYIAGSPDGTAPLDKSYFAFTGTGRFGARSVSHVTEITTFVKAFNADGELRVCGAYVADIDDFRREALISMYSQRRAGLVIGKGADAVSLPVNFMRFNDARDAVPFIAGCTRTGVARKTSFKESPGLLTLRMGNSPPRF